MKERDGWPEWMVGRYLLQCYERQQIQKRETWWLLYLVLQLHDLVVLFVELCVLVLHDFEKLLDVVVLPLHKSLRTKREGGRLCLGVAKGLRRGTSSVTHHRGSSGRHKPFNSAFSMGLCAFPLKVQISLPLKWTPSLFWSFLEANYGQLHRLLLLLFSLCFHMKFTFCEADPWFKLKIRHWQKKCPVFRVLAWDLEGQDSTFCSDMNIQCFMLLQNTVTTCFSIGNLVPTYVFPCIGIKSINTCRILWSWMVPAGTTNVPQFKLPASVLSRQFLVHWFVVSWWHKKLWAW